MTSTVFVVVAAWVVNPVVRQESVTPPLALSVGAGGVKPALADSPPADIGFTRRRADGTIDGASVVCHLDRKGPPHPYGVGAHQRSGVLARLR